MPSSNQQIISDAYAAFGRGDAAAVLSAFSPGIVWNEAENVPYADRNPYLGPDAVAEGVFGRLATEWEGFTVTPEQFVSEGNTVVALGRYTGRFGATGQRLNAQFAHVWTLEDGRVTRFQQYTDTLQYARVTEASAPLSA